MVRDCSIRYSPLAIRDVKRGMQVLTRASQKSDKLTIVAGYSRSEEKPAAFAREMGVRAVPA